jgi:hypothetical protein
VHNTYAADIQQQLKNRTWVAVKKISAGQNAICTGCNALLQIPQHQPHVRLQEMLPS